jgi:hypothetical protein
MSQPVTATTSKDKSNAQPERRPRDLPQQQFSGATSGILSLQRAAGNTAVTRLLRSEIGGGYSPGGVIQRKHLSCDTPEDLPSPCKDEEMDQNDQSAVLDEIQPKLTVSQPGDPYEQEADRVAEQVMRMPDLPTGSVSQTQLAVQRKCSACSTGGSTCPKCEDEIQRSSLASTPSILLQRQVTSHAARASNGGASQSRAAFGGSSDVPASIGARIQSARGRGQPLAAPTRTFFESRFGLDLGGVRIHRGTDATETAKVLRARAFTIGRDIMFGAGEYAPDTAGGKRLLAHELTHVVQQTRPANLVTRKAEMIPGHTNRYVAQPRQRASQNLIQCDKIDHRTLLWDDFKGKVPKKTTFEAGTFSNFHDLDLAKFNASKLESLDTGTACKIGKKASTVFSATLTIDPDDIEVKAYMDQDKSWAKDWTKDNKAREVLCKKNFVKNCEASFKGQHKKIAKQVKAQVKTCEKSAKKSVPFTLTLDGQEIEITSVGDCAANFGTALEQLLKGQLKWTAKLAGEEAEVTNLADCSTTFLQECIDRLYQAESDRLLRHEQGHFDITNVMAEKTQEALRALAGGFKTDFQGCGDAKATAKAKAALKSYAKKLQKRYNTGKTALGKTQKSYDKQTKHGIVEKQQAKWEDKIAKGLP